MPWYLIHDFLLAVGTIVTVCGVMAALGGIASMWTGGKR